jgi:succinate-acetate transporter protein
VFGVGFGCFWLVLQMVNYNENMGDDMSLDKEDVILLYCALSVVVLYVCFIYLCKVIVHFA